MSKSNIQWTHFTENPIRRKDSLANYCTKVSEGCEHCYAEIMSRRLAAISKTEFIPYRVQRIPPEMELHQDVIDGWAKHKRPYRHFIGSMTDIFMNIIPEEWVFKILDGCMRADNQIFQILTKRSERAMNVINEYCYRRGISELPDHIWVGVSAENQKWYMERTEHLCRTKCSVRFVSCEPLQGPIDLEDGCLDTFLFNPADGICDCPEIPHGYHGRIHWVIAGGESGYAKDIAPAHPDWFRGLRDQCAKYAIPFFFKQWGEYCPVEFMGGSTAKDHKLDKKEFIFPDGLKTYRLGKKTTGDMLDGLRHQYFPGDWTTGFTIQ